MREASTLGLVFSKDRPLQLDAVLRSLHRHCQDMAALRVQILYRASTSRMLSFYRRLAVEYPHVDFVRETEFQRDLRTLLRGWPYVFFLVDDSIFARDFSIAAIRDALEKNPDALGYSLRLGRNTAFCYTLNRAQKLPEFAGLPDGALKFRWPEAECDFGYPLELSSSVYRGGELLSLLQEITFQNPNTLEEALWRAVDRFKAARPFLICAPQSLAFSIPINKVQQIFPNRAASDPSYSADILAGAFSRGGRVNVGALDGFTPKACHEEVELKIEPSASAVPLVSVIVPCFKQAEYLPGAVASVVAQTFPDWELIIVNDGSPDNTNTVASELIKKYPERRIRLLEKRNGGLAHARNAGIDAAAAAYILPLDADDMIAPEFLARTVALLDAEPDVAIAYTDVAHFGAAEKVIQAAEFDFQKLREGNQLNYCSLFRREAWEKAGGYNPNMIWGYEDWDFWIGCGEEGLIARRIPGALLQYRVKAASMFTVAVAHDRPLRARMVLNHPALHTPEKVVEAESIWSDPSLPNPPGAPRVSVIVPTFNRPDRLEEALRSVAGQTLKDIEVIVVNDNGVDVAHVVARCSPGLEIIYLRHSSNRGIAAARNTGLRRARGRYIAYLDDDDIFLPDHLQTLADFLETTGNKAAYTDAWCAEEALRNGHYEVARREVRYSVEWDNDEFLVRNLVPVLCFMHDRRAGIAAGGFDEQMTTHEDWEYWIRLSRVCAPVHIKKVTCEFRVRQDGNSLSSSRREDFLRTLRLIYKKHRRLAAGNKTVKRGQRDFLHGLKKEIRRQNPRPWARWFRNAFKS